MGTELNNIHKEVKALLEVFGYKPEVETYRSSFDEIIVDMHFHVNNGYETMPIRHKDAIIMLAKGYLAEFYYGQDTQHVRLYSRCKGLRPDDDRYGCLLHEIRTVDADEPWACHRSGTEIFVNMGDHFKRFVNWKDVKAEPIKPIIE